MHSSRMRTARSLTASRSIQGACRAGGGGGGRHAWQGVCMVGVCVVGGIHVRGRVWQRGHA